MKHICSFLLTFLGIATIACSNPTNYTNTDVAGFTTLIADSLTQILDVRTAEEFAQGHIPGAVNIDMKQDSFMQSAQQQLTPDHPVAIYCRSGRRSAMAAKWLGNKGYTVTNLEGGILDWQRQKRPIVTASLPTSSSDEQSWFGKLQIAQSSLTIVLHFRHTSNGTKQCTMDSPDQGAKDIPAQIIHHSSDSLHITIPALGIVCHGHIRNEKFAGIFSQHGHNIPLTMTQGEESLSRPQEPIPPFPYQTKEVTFSNADANATFAATLTYPVHYDSNTHTDVVLLVSGSGAQDRDETIFDHRPFLVIADYLARHGIASLRYDDRNFAQSRGGDTRHATTQDFATDAEAALHYLRSSESFTRFGIIGHSEGANIAFMLAAKGQADFIISLAGVGVRGDLALCAQNNRILELNGISKQISVEEFRQQVQQHSTPWLDFFINYDPADDITRTHCPAMILNGQKDCQVIALQNISAIRRHLPAHAKTTYKTYPDLNHLFQHCTTGLPEEYRTISETFSEEVLRDMAQWIKDL